VVLECDCGVRLQFAVLTAVGGREGVARVVTFWFWGEVEMLM